MSDKWESSKKFYFLSNSGRISRESSGLSSAPGLQRHSSSFISATGEITVSQPDRSSNHNELMDLMSSAKKKDVEVKRPLLGVGMLPALPAPLPCSLLAVP